jgi:hypothetical protein
LVCMVISTGFCNANSIFRSNNFTLLLGVLHAHQTEMRFSGTTNYPKPSRCSLCGK